MEKIIKDNLKLIDCLNLYDKIKNNDVTTSRIKKV